MAVARTGEPVGALRYGAYKLLVGDLDVGWLRCDMQLEKPTPSQGTRGSLNGTYLLFDLRSDPYERHDLSASPSPEHRAALEALLGRWAHWKAEAAPPDYPDSDPRSYPEHFEGAYRGAWKPWLGPEPPRGASSH